MAMYASLAMSSPQAVADAPVTFLLTVYNTGNSTVNITGIQTVMSPSAAPGQFAAFNASPADISAGVLTIPVSSASSVQRMLRAVFFAPSIPGGPASTNAQVKVSVICSASDSTVFQTNVLNIAVGAAIKVLPTSGEGDLRFDTAINSALTL